MDEKYYCQRCKKELNWEQINFFGSSFYEGKKVWCREHFEDLQQYLKQKRQEETIPLLIEQAEENLKEFEKQRKKITDIISQTKRFITSLKNKNITNEQINDITFQKKLNEVQQNGF